MSIRMYKAFSAGAAFLILAAAGCTDTTVEPKSTIAETNVFSDPSSYKAFIAKLYAGLAVTGQQGPAGNQDITTNDEGFFQYLRVFWCSEELPTDAAIIGWNDVGLPELNTQTWGETNGFVVAWYYRIFYQVTLANEFLRQTTDDKLSERGVTEAWRTQIKQYRAEARFLRALSYWHGIDAFANIPLITEADPLGSTPPQQSTRTAIYDFIVAELNEIKSDLPPAGLSSSYGRATPAAANMLLAKLFLNSAVYTGTPRWAEARAAVEAVIGSSFSLDPNYRRMFMADNHTSPEIIFAVPQDGLKTQTWGGMTFLVHAAVGGDMNAENYGIDGGWWGLRLKPEAFHLFGPGDIRSSYFVPGNSVEISNVGDFYAGVAAPKFSNKTSSGVSGSNATHPDTDFPMFRLADAYLMYAEAVVRGGGGSQTQAVAYVNALRQRAYGNTSGNITEGQLTLDFILDERGRELLWEGHRRTDLVRFGKFTGGDYVWSWKGGVQAGRATAAHLDIYPLPQNELVANPNLTQNPGY